MKMKIRLLYVVGFSFLFMYVLYSSGGNILHVQETLTSSSPELQTKSPIDTFKSRCQNSDFCQVRHTKIKCTDTSIDNAILNTSKLHCLYRPRDSPWTASDVGRENPFNYFERMSQDGAWNCNENAWAVDGIFHTVDGVPNSTAVITLGDGSFTGLSLVYPPSPLTTFICCKKRCPASNSDDIKNEVKPSTRLRKLIYKFVKNKNIVWLMLVIAVSPEDDNDTNQMIGEFSKLVDSFQEDYWKFSIKVVLLHYNKYSHTIYAGLNTVERQIQVARTRNLKFVPFDVLNVSHMLERIGDCGQLYRSHSLTMPYTAQVATAHMLLGFVNVYSRVVGDGKIYKCGDEVKLLAKFLFPERVLTDLDKKITNTVDSVLLIGGDDCDRDDNYNSSDFRGFKVRLQGEEDFEPANLGINELYLGPAKLGDTLHNMQLYYVQFVAMYFGLDLLLQPRKQQIGKKFMLYLQSNCIDYREEAFNLIVESLPNADAVAGTGCHGKHPELQQHVVRDNPLMDLKAIVNYRFHLCMENQLHKGYVTEKLLKAFLGGGIPIYYGTTEVFQIFNKEAFLYYDIHNPNATIRRIVHLEANRTAYREVLSQPILAKGALEKYFSWMGAIGNGRLKQAIRQRVFH